MYIQYLGISLCKRYADDVEMGSAALQKEVVVNPAISVVLPIFKPDLHQLIEALDSISDQTFRDFECLCIYDAPDEATTQILSEYVKKDLRFKILFGSNSGLIDALNYGLNSASGRYIARMDADDISLKERFQFQYELLEVDNFDIVGGHYFVINGAGKYISARVVPIKLSEINLTLGSTVPFAHSSVMIRANYLKKEGLRYGLGKHKVAEDYQLWTQMVAKGARFGNVDGWILKYRWGENSLSQRVKAKNKKDMLRIRDEYFSNNNDKLYEAVVSLVSTKNSDEIEEAIVYMAWKFAIKKLYIKPIFMLYKKSRRFIAQGILKYLFEKI